MRRTTKKRIEGIISVMLAFLMLPFISVAGVVVETGRYYSINTMLSEILGSASYSTLANYDSYLQDRFGLLATDQEETINETFQNYFESNRNLISQSGIADLKLNAQGIYPLTDPDILYYQVSEMDKLLAPTTLAKDGLDLDSILGILTKSCKFTGILKIGTAIGKVIEKMADTADKLDTLRETCEDLKTMKETTQPNDYQTFSSALDEYKTAADKYAEAKKAAEDAADALDSANKSLEEAKAAASDSEDSGENDGDDEEQDQNDFKEEENAVSEAQDAKEEADNALEAAKTDLENKKNAAITARDAYAKTVDDYANLLQKYKEGIEGYKDSKASVVTATASLASTSVSVGADWNKSVEEEKKDAIKDKYGEESKEYQNALEEYNTQADAVDLMDKVIDKTSKGCQTMVDSLNDAVKGHLDDNMDPYIVNMRQVANDIRTIDLSLTEDNKIHDDVQLADYGFDKPETIPAEDIKKAIDEQDEKLNSSGLLDYIKALVDTINTVLNFKGILDTELNAVVGQETVQVAFSDVNMSDAQKAAANIAEINQTVTGSVEPQMAGIEQSELVKLLEYISETVANATTVSQASGFVKKLKAIAKTAISAGQAMAQMAKVISGLDAALTLLKSSYDRLMYDQYLVGMLPNRTNYASGTAMNSYSYKNIAYKDKGTNLNAGIIVSLAALIEQMSDKTLGNDKMFCGAELEYIINGSPSEYANQVATFGYLWIARALIDLPSILSNEVMQALMETGIGIVVVFIIALLEPLCDMVLLVNGGKVSLWKDNPYLSPMGIASFINAIVGLKVSAVSAQSKADIEELEKDMGDAVNEMTNVTVKTDAGDVTHSFDTGISGLDKYATGLLDLDYSQHCLLLMFITGNRKTYFQRFANLIQMEAAAQYRKKNKIGEFDLSRSYTFIRSQASAAANQILPIPTLANNSRLTFSVIQYRGY